MPRQNGLGHYRRERLRVFHLVADAVLIAAYVSARVNATFVRRERRKDPSICCGRARSQSCAIVGPRSRFLPLGALVGALPALVPIDLARRRRGISSLVPTVIRHQKCDGISKN